MLAKIFEVKKKFGPKKVWVKKIVGRKKNWVKKNLGRKKIPFKVVWKWFKYVWTYGWSKPIRGKKYMQKKIAEKKLGRKA